MRDVDHRREACRGAYVGPFRAGLSTVRPAPIVTLATIAAVSTTMTVPATTIAFAALARRPCVLR